MIDVRSASREACELLLAAEYDDANLVLRAILAADSSRFIDWHNLGIVYCERDRDTSTAIDCFRQALRIAPDHMPSRLALAHTILSAGDLHKGLLAYRWRHEGADDREWQGQDIDGERIEVFPEGGFGDYIMFSRFIHRMMNGYPGLEIWNDPYDELQRLYINGDHRIDGVLVSRPVREEPKYVVRLMDVPFFLGMTNESVGGKPYLSVDRALDLPQDTFNIGIVWAAKDVPDNPTSRRRSARLADFAALRSIPGVRLWSLQVGPAGDQFDDPSSCLSPTLTDFYDTAVAMMGMDLIVTVDTSALHLAGALGVPTFGLLHWCPDWRWYPAWRKGGTSKWYDSVRLFDQSRPNDWTEVISRVARAITRHPAKVNHEKGVLYRSHP